MFFFLNIHRSGVLTALAWLVPHETASVSAQVLCTPYNHAACHFMQSHIRKVYACLAVTCHLHFWQNDRDLLRATAVTRGWNRYRNKSQHRKSTLEKKILPPLQQGFEPATFQSRVRRSNHWAIPYPRPRHVVGKPLDSFKTLHEKRLYRKLMQILNDRAHPMRHYFDSRRSNRSGRFVFR